MLSVFVLSLDKYNYVRGICEYVEEMFEIKLKVTVNDVFSSYKEHNQPLRMIRII